ncbi:MAG: cardiolipin synthase [Syntrophotaleaceae bacterium]
MLPLLKIVFTVLVTAAAFFSAGHALLHKRDPRSALGWVAVCFALPIVGPLFYWLLGVNRIRTRARDWQAQLRDSRTVAPAGYCSWSSRRQESITLRDENYASLLALADKVTRRPLQAGNRVALLHNGEDVYPAMLEAIRGARESVYLSTYIYDTDSSGRALAYVLIAAAERGLDVRVLIDGLGELYSLPLARSLFRHSPVHFARFLPPSLSGRGLHFNLRNHRKLLIVDSQKGFTGGMNIGDRHLAGLSGRRQALDIHFQVEGPVVGQMLEAFMEDWQFVTGDVFPSIPYRPPLPGGEALCRGISAGPNEDFEKLRWIYLGAINCALRRIRIMTPYFIPDRTLMAALNAAALRGAEVILLLPAKSNLPYVSWASRAYYRELIEYGVRLYLQPPPFVHSKLALIDEQYVLIGSANLDPRSLRLNFEFNLEVYDRGLNQTLADYFDKACERSSLVSLDELNRQGLAGQVRDGVAKLFSPYL